MTGKRVLYHANCFDGAAAAWACRQHPDWAEADLVPCAYGDPVPVIDGDDILIVDFSFPRAVLLGMKTKAKSLHIYDHHRTAQEDLDGLSFCTFNMNRSGAGLVWDCLIGGSRPVAIDYIEDRDLWRHRLPHAAEVQAWMSTFPTTYETIEHLVATLGSGVPAAVVAMGESILSYRRLIIETAAADGAVDVEFNGYTGRAINFGVNGLYSEVAHEVGKDCAFGLAYMFKPDGTVNMSFRSGDHGTDVSKIAKLFGGGGHKHAAGARPLRELFMLAVFENTDFGFARSDEDEDDDV